MKNRSLRYGFIGAAAVVFYFAVCYFVRKEVFLNPAVQWASLLIYVACMFKAASEDVAENGAARDFRELTRTPFVVFLLVNIGYWLFFYGIHLADPALLQMEAALQLQYFQEQLNAGVGDPQQANHIREQIQYLEKEGMSLPLGAVFQRMAMGAIGGFGLAALISAFFKFKD